MVTKLHAGDALLVVDVQNDFCAGGALGIEEGHHVIPILNRWIAEAVSKRVPVFATRDWHPEGHISFKERGGPWPPHCVQNQFGSEFRPELNLPKTAQIVNKGAHPDKDS